MNVERLRKLATKIETLIHTDEGVDFECGDAEDEQVPPFFNMQSYFWDCGTPSCIAGWAIYMFRDDYKDDEYASRINESDGIQIKKFACRVFGLDETKHATLFTPEGDRHVSYSEIPTESAVNTINRLIETGEVTWDHQMTPELAPEL